MNGSGLCEGISVFGFESVSVGMKSPGVEGFFLVISEGENGRDRRGFGRAFNLGFYCVLRRLVEWSEGGDVKGSRKRAVRDIWGQVGRFVCGEVCG